MSTPGSNRNKTPFDTSRRKQSSGPTVDFTFNTSSFSPDAHRRAAQYQNNFSQPFPPQSYDLGARPTGPLDIQMGNFGLLPPPRSPSRHQKPNSQPPAPGPYDGPGHVSPSPRHMMTPRMDDFPKDFGGRAQPPPNSHRSKPQSGYQTVPYPPSMTPTPGVPRSPTTLTEHRISTNMGPRPPQSPTPQQGPRPGSHADPRYSTHSRGY